MNNPFHRNQLITAMFIGQTVNTKKISELMENHCFDGGYIEFFDELVQDVCTLADIKEIGWQNLDGGINGVFDYEVTETYMNWYVSYTLEAQNTPPDQTRRNKILSLAVEFFDPTRESNKYSQLVLNLAERVNTYAQEYCTGVV